ncbi:acetate/propionate family kinase [Arthrobacter sp. JZ12]|uniref:acetate/propionate family kinase n=1 Tax=Arthrobacter sp. JZ12 TaxID=2654190 RepID=UPI002B480990|nr:acetate kinase [Arthrobacter sp. JZ12]WRH23787.1 acetate/propionate family kinase [Arthrobacter sp. JZ12]
MIILVINSGSSSLKYQVRDPDTGERLASGLIERIGDSSHGGPSNHAEALDRVTEELEATLQGKPIDAVGHRVVHGGERFSEPVLINNEIIRAIDRLNPLAPLHNPANVQGIRAIAERWPDMPQVAVFDTAFHRTLPEHAWRYAVPDELYKKYGIRRYGFHGTSFEYVTRHAAQMLGLQAADFTGIVAHLGNGASVTAVQGGRSIDTSMGFTPLEGLVMGTRSGDIDPSILLFLLREGYTEQDLDQLLNRESGLKGLTGHNDMRSIEEEGSPAGMLALDIASYRLAKYIGGYHVAVGGAQALVFTAGIGENAWRFRERVVKRLGALGVFIDDAENQKPGGAAREISTEESAFPVLVVPTDEEAAIAEATAAVVLKK